MLDRKETRLILPAYERVRELGEKPGIEMERYYAEGADILVFREGGAGRFVG